MQQSLIKRVKHLCDDLYDSEGKREQNFSTLAEHIDEKVTNYCALGALGCEQKMIYTKYEGRFENDTIKEWHLKEPPYDAIINAYGLKNKFTKKFFMPLREIAYEGKAGDVTMEVYTDLTGMITECNDLGRMSFGEIADLILEIGKRGYITTCSDKKMEKAEKYKLVEEESE